MPDYVGIIITVSIFLFLPQAIFCARERRRLCPEQGRWLWKDWIPFYNMVNLHNETGSSLAYIYGCIVLIVGALIPFIIGADYLAAFIIWSGTALIFELCTAIFTLPYIKTVTTVISDRTFFSVVSSIGLLYYAIFLYHRHGDHYGSGALNTEDITIPDREMYEKYKDVIPSATGFASGLYGKNKKPKVWGDNQAVWWLKDKASTDGRVLVVAEQDDKHARIANLGPSANCIIRPVLILIKPEPKKGQVKARKIRKTYPDPGDEFTYRSVDFVMLDDRYAIAKKDGILRPFSKAGSVTYEGSDAEEMAVRWALERNLIPDDIYTFSEPEQHKDNNGYEKGDEQSEYR